MLVPALFLSIPLAGDVHVDEVRGFQIDVPEGWTKVEQEIPKGLVLALTPPGVVAGVKSVQVQVLDGAEVGITGPETFLSLSRERMAAGGDRFSDFEEWQDELAGREAPGVRVTVATPAGSYRISQSAVFERGKVFVVQRNAPVDEYDGLVETLDAVAHTFRLVEISESGQVELRLTELLGRCGSEVEWAKSWSEAARRARDEGKLVLVVAFFVPGFSISNTPRTTTFMDEDVIDLVNERYVPLWYEKGMRAAFADRYGMGGSTFGQALLVVTPDGDVVVETHGSSNPDVAYPFLCAGLARRPESAGTPPAPDLEVLDRAERHVARGELAEALSLLKDREEARAHRLRGRVLRLLRRGEEALAALAAARAAGGEPEEELAVEEAVLHVRGGRLKKAAGMLADVVREHRGTDAALEAELHLGLLEYTRGDREAGKSRWRRVAAEHPDSRWAWAAASVLKSILMEVDLTPDLGWPDEEILRSLLDFPVRAAAGAAHVGEARDGALAWLLHHQRPDGSWAVPSELSGALDAGANPFADATTALAGRALLRYGEAEGALAAARRALTFVLASVASREEEPPVVLFMDYMTWSDSMMLHFLADALDAGLARRAEVEPTARALVEDMRSRQVEGAGWSYFVTGDVGGDKAPAQSISFTTAGAVLALARARAVGLDVPDDVIDPAAGALEKMRTDEGVFTYFLYQGTERGKPSTEKPGAVGRGPACELALASTGRSTGERLRKSLDMFLEHIDLYSAQQAKALMHAGPDAQGCHYLFFDYAHAALAEATLPPDGKTRAVLTEVTLECRQPDGSFVDTPLMGRAYGTAMALIVLDALATADGR